MSNWNPDPVSFKEKSWGYYDETWANFTGDFADEESACKALKEYIDVLNGVFGL